MNSVQYSVRGGVWCGAHIAFVSPINFNYKLFKNAQFFRKMRHSTTEQKRWKNKNEWKKNKWTNFFPLYYVWIDLFSWSVDVAQKTIVWSELPSFNDIKLMSMKNDKRLCVLSIHILMSLSRSLSLLNNTCFSYCMYHGASLFSHLVFFCRLRFTSAKRRTVIWRTVRRTVIFLFSFLLFYLFRPIFIAWMFNAFRKISIFSRKYSTNNDHWIIRVE